MKYRKKTEENDLDMMKNKLGMTVFVAVFAVVLCCSVISRAAMNDDVDLSHEQQVKKINITIDKAGIGQVVEKVSAQTGYRVIFSNFDEQKIKSMTVTGQFMEVTVDELFNRIFRSNNTLIIHDNKEKVVEVRFFGDKLMNNSFVTENQFSDVTPLNQGSVTLMDDSEPIDPLTGLSVTFLNDKHREQQEELERFRNDPASVDPLTGLNLLELQERHHNQESAMQEKLVDDYVVDTKANMTLEELKSRHEKARQELEERKISGVDPLTGISVAELNERHRRQAKEFEERYKSGIN